MARATRIDDFLNSLHAHRVESAYAQLYPGSETLPAQPASCSRLISPQAGHSLEILGHAIEYLVDEYVHAGGAFCPDDPQFEAIQILMAANRAVYYACPRRTTFFERIEKLLGR
jgi:hypothetical protein